MTPYSAEKPRDTTPFEPGFQMSAKQQLQRDPVELANLFKDVTRENPIPKNSLRGTGWHQR